MNPNKQNGSRLLAIAPCVQGIGFIVFDDAETPIDWGVRWIRTEKNAKGLAWVAGLIARYQPDAVVFEDYRDEGSRRAPRIAALLASIEGLAKKRGIETARYSRRDLQRRFQANDAMTKQEIATVIADRLPELAPRLPAPRRIWLPEHANLSLFDAAALALTHYAAIDGEGDVGLDHAA